MPHSTRSESRRDFLTKSVAGVGLILGAPSVLSAQTKNSPSEELRVAFIGCGKQQDVLFSAMQNLPGIRFVAACDLMKHRLGRTYGMIRSRFDYEINRYFDPEEMLTKEDAIDAVFVATPDFWHAAHAAMALEADCHVYCETMMSNTLEGAKSILQAAEKSGKLCQIGYHKRSHPFYRYTWEQLLQKHNLLGDMMRVEAQRFRSINRSRDITFHKAHMLPDQKILKKFGFNNPYEFLNWRMIPRLSAGLTSEFSAHQIDAFNWYLGRSPKKVYSSGTRSYFVERECFDTINTLLDYEFENRTLQAVQRVTGTSVSQNGYFESFNGMNGSAQLSERKAFQGIFRACGTAPKEWQDLVRRGYLKQNADALENLFPEDYSWDSICHETIGTRGNPYYQIPGEVNRPPHSYHVENFFDAIRGKAELNCDAQTAFATERVLHAMTQSSEEATAVSINHYELQ